MLHAEHMMPIYNSMSVSYCHFFTSIVHTKYHHISWKSWKFVETDALVLTETERHLHESHALFKVWCLWSREFECKKLRFHSLFFVEQGLSDLMSSLTVVLSFCRNTRACYFTTARHKECLSVYTMPASRNRWGVRDTRMCLWLQRLVRPAYRARAVLPFHRPDCSCVWLPPSPASVYL